jgi:predicted RecB family nuclease
VAPQGFVILQDEDGQQRCERLELQPEHFDRVRQLLAVIRQLRTNGIRLRVCKCPVCAGPGLPLILKTKDLTLINGIGTVHSEHLEQVGICDYDQLAVADFSKTATDFRHRGYRPPGRNQFIRWQHHAEAYRIANPVFFGEPVQLEESFIAMDLEYVPRPEPGARIFVVGLSVVIAGRIHLEETIWADSAKEEQKNVNRLFNVVALYPNLPVVTWHGKGADIPQIQRVRKKEFASKLKCLISRHLDLYRYVDTAYRFPTPWLSLESVAGSFGISKTSPLRSGREAAWRFQEYRLSHDEEIKDRLKNEIIEHNRADVKALVAVALRLVRASRSRRDPK